MANVIHHSFPLNQYFPEITEKSQIVLHHTVSGDNVDGDINWWIQTPERVATCVIIARDGTIHTLYRSETWAHHLGIKTWIFKKFNISSYGANKKLNQGSIGLELDSWGGLVKRNSKYYRTGDKEISEDKVVDYGREIRGFRYYEKYTDAQIESVRYLLKYWNNKYKIPISYNQSMWELNEKALKGYEGVWTHVSFRPDKSDCHPQKELIEMLKTL
jgi:N-acetyl-anhydromuramyl-L-alanine amidase AmpD